jgi:hypothetical protein
MSMYTEFLESTPEEKEINEKLMENTNFLHDSYAYKEFLKREDELWGQLREIRAKKTPKLFDVFKSKTENESMDKVHVPSRPKKTKDFSHIENHIKEYLSTLSDDEKRAFGRIYSIVSGFDKVNEYENPVTTTDHIKKLQEILVQVCINYINENNLTDIEEISFNADSLQTSAKYAQWTPATDSYIGVYGYQDENEMKVRRLIGEYF